MMQLDAIRRRLKMTQDEPNAKLSRDFHTEIYVTMYPLQIDW